MAGVLEGIRVLDFGRHIAGPFVGTMLGDFGAEVIRVEKLMVVPSLSGNFSYTVPSLAQDLPEALQIRSAGITSAEPNDGDITGCGSLSFGLSLE